MKLAPVNDVNVCELVSISEMDVFSICSNSLTIYQVGGLQKILVTNATVTFSEWLNVCCIN